MPLWQEQSWEGPPWEGQHLTLFPGAATWAHLPGEATHPSSSRRVLAGGYLMGWS